MQLEWILLGKRAGTFIASGCRRFIVVARLHVLFLVLCRLSIGFSIRLCRRHLAFRILSRYALPSEIGVTNFYSVLGFIVPFRVVILFFGEEIFLNSLH